MIVPPRFPMIASNPRFTQGYQSVLFATSAPKRHSGRIYIKRDSERIGIRPTERGLLVPGFLIEAKQPAVANRHGSLVGRVGVGERAVLNLGRPAPLGTIHVRSYPAGAAMAVVDRRHRDRLVITITQNDPVEIESVLIVGP